MRRSSTSTRGRTARWKDVAWGEQRLHVRRALGRYGVKVTKGVHGRSVPMMPALVSLLDELSRRGHTTGSDDLVLVDAKGDRINGNTLRAAFYAGVEAAGLGHLRESDPPLRFHDLRHGFATMAARALLGHAHISTTMRYVHYLPAAREADRLAAAWAIEDEDPRGDAVTPIGTPTREIERPAA
jgi:integrase